MLFNSLEFLLFLPIVFGLYWFVMQRNLRAQNMLLVIASYVFYGWWDWRFLGLIAFSTVVDYLVGLQIEEAQEKRTKKAWLGVSLLVNLGLLCYFKYSNFFIDSWVDAWAAAGVTINRDDTVVLNGSLPWGGIPSNGGNITGSAPSQYYTRNALGIPKTDFGSTGAWGTHCGRKKWALDNGIAWDGVSNSNVDCSNYMGVGNPDNVYSRGVRS
mgnify:CR=1 FL=1